MTMPSFELEAPGWPVHRLPGWLDDGLLAEKSGPHRLEYPIARIQRQSVRTRHDAAGLRLEDQEEVPYGWWTRGISQGLPESRDEDTMVPGRLVRRQMREHPCRCLAAARHPVNQRREPNHE
jgi:hypothetical protein